MFILLFLLPCKLAWNPNIRSFPQKLSLRQWFGVRGSYFFCCKEIPSWRSSVGRMPVCVCVCVSGFLCVSGVLVFLFGGEGSKGTSPLRQPRGSFCSGARSSMGAELKEIRAAFLWGSGRCGVVSSAKSWGSLQWGSSTSCDWRKGWMKPVILILQTCIEKLMGQFAS